MRLESPVIGVVGGYGKMGNWFVRYFENLGLKVMLTGREGDRSSRDLVRECDVVLLSVPMDVTMDAIRKLGPMVREDALLMDVTSLKKAPLTEMLNCSRSEVVGTHPLFGPEAADTTGLRIALCPGRGDSGLPWLKNLLEGSGMKPVVLDADAHDRIMGIVQGVNHFLTVSMALCLEESGFPVEALLDCATQTFQRRVNRIRSLLNQPSGLFGGILMDNPETKLFVDQLISAVKRLQVLIEEEDRDGFRAMFEGLQTYFHTESTGGDGRG